MGRKGFTIVEILIVVVVIGILVALAIPNFQQARARVQKDTCINNLRQIKLAKEQWATDNNKASGDTPAAANLDTYIKDGTSSLHCPLDSSGSFSSSYTINNMAADPECGISPADHRL